LDHPVGRHLERLRERSALALHRQLDAERPTRGLLDQLGQLRQVGLRCMAVKHSGGTTATVRLRYRPAALEVEILDDGPHAPATAAGGGLGLVGMRERVALHGGELRAGERPQGGFAVLATFPVNGGGA